jgi:hypothetical protein
MKLMGHIRGLEDQLREDQGALEALLVLGDAWLDLGHPRGELIALEHALRSGGGAIEVRIEEIFENHWAELVGSLSELPRGDVGLRWGYPWRVKLKGYQLSWLEDPCCWVISELTVEGLLELALLSPLKLTSLGLGDNSIGVEGARALASSPHLSGLTSLNLRWSNLGDEGVKALAESPHLSGLTSLDLWGNRIGVEGARALADSPHLRGLTSLDLKWNSIGDEGARALASSPHLSQLTSLDLGDNAIGDEGAQALASSPHLSGLTSLDLWGNRIGAEGARSLASSPHLSDTVKRQLKKDLGS